jgi:membrane protein required for colicin V production
VVGIATAAASTTTNWLDPAVVGIVAISGLFGLLRGLLRSLAGIAGVVLGALFAGKLADKVDPALKQAGIQHPAINGRWAFLIAFVAIVVAVEFAANLLVWVERFMMLGWLDRVGGLAIGLARGVLLSMILLAGFAQFDSAQFNQQATQSQVAAWLWDNVPALATMLPPGMLDSTTRLIEDQSPFRGERLNLPAALSNLPKGLNL